MLSQILSILIASHLAYAAPLPAVITRVHTAEAVTTTQTHTTGTTTVFLPPVELLISNGVSYTFTLTDSEWNTYATTQTSIYNDEQKIDSAPASQTTSTAAPVATQTVTTQVSTPQTSTPQTSTPQTATPSTTQIAQATSQATQQATTITSTQQVATSSAAAQQATTLTTLTTIQQATTQQATTQQTTTQQTTTQQATTEQATTLTTQTSTQQATTQQTTTSTQANSATSASNGLISAPSTIVYSPYQDDGSCKTVDTIASDLEVISGKGIKKIRVYGTDCNNFSGILPKCAELGISVNQGVWFSSAGVSSIDSSVADIISYGEANGWSVFELITIGNEAVNDGYVSVSDLISKISSVKSQLQSSGYTGQVTTSEPPVSFENNPTLCTDSDIDVVGINPHSYFNSGVDASQAGTFVMGQKAIVEGICGSKQVIITETGYPSQGNTNGLNVPSAANQKIAIASLIKESGGDLTILTTYNDYWKTPGPYGIEQYFGAITLFN